MSLPNIIIIRFQEKMGNKGTTFASGFILRADLPELKRGTVRGAYLEYNQFPLSGVIGISSTSVEMFNAMNGALVHQMISPVEIICSDFNPAQKILAIGLKDGTVRILNPKSFATVQELFYDPKQKQGVEVTAINCRIKKRVIVGYANGIAKEFNLSDGTQMNVFLNVGVDSAIDPGSKDKSIANMSGAKFIEVLDQEKLVFIGYNNETTHKSTVCVYKSGTSPSQVTMTCKEGDICAMKVLDRSKVLIVLTQGNELGVFNYMDGEQIMHLQVNIPGLTENNKIVAMSSLSFTKQLRQVYTGVKDAVALDKEDETGKSDALYFGFANGEILSCKFSIKISDTKLECIILPQHIYRAQIDDKTIVEKKGLSICSLFIDPVTDWVLAGNLEGAIKSIERTILRMLNPAKAKSVDDEMKAKTSSWIYKMGLSGWTPVEMIFGRSEPKTDVPLKDIKPTDVEKKEDLKVVEKKGLLSDDEEKKKATEKKNIFERLANQATTSPKEVPIILAPHEKKPEPLPGAKDLPTEIKKEAPELQLDKDIKIEIS